MNQSVLTFTTFFSRDVGELSGQVRSRAIMPHKYASQRAGHYMSLRHAHKHRVWNEERVEGKDGREGRRR